MTLLAVDIGNTETVIALYGQSGLGPTGQGDPGSLPPQEAATACLTPDRVWRLASRRNVTGDELAVSIQMLFDRSARRDTGARELPERILIASVVPTLNRPWSEAAAALGLQVRFLTGDCPLPVRLEVDNPREVGADRIANTMAAAAIYARDTLVVDLGTAATFDCVSAGGAFLGGAIAPGPATAMEHLSKAAAQLPHAVLEEPARAIGKNTLACLASGGFYSVVSGIDGIVGRLITEWDLAAPPLVVATGGLAGRLAPHCAVIELTEPALTVAGIALADRLLSESD